MTKRPADSKLLIESAKRFAGLVGAAVPSEERIQRVIDKVVVERGAIESAEQGLMTKDEAVLLFLSHLHSAFFMTSGVQQESEPWNDPELLCSVKRGLFGPHSNSNS